MASSLQTIEFIAGQIETAGSVRYKKMFGEYMIYLNDKPIFLISDDTLFVKINEETTRRYESSLEKAPPYSGAKNHFVVDFVDDREKMVELALALEATIELPIKKRIKQK